MCCRGSIWLLFLQAALLLADAVGNLAAQSELLPRTETATNTKTVRGDVLRELLPSTETATDEKTVSRDILRHPKSPPALRQADVPLGSTLVRLQLEGGEWNVIIEDDAPDTEVRALLDRICREAGEENPKKTAAVLAGKLAAAKYGYERTVWWFEGMGALDVFDEHLAEVIASAADHPVHVLEIGSYEGGSAMWFAKNLLLNTDSVLFCIDSWEGSPELKSIGIDMSAAEANFRKNIARAPNGERVALMKGESMLALTALVRDGATSTFDVIYVDGDHSMTNAMADGLLSFRLLKVGGLMIFDDMLFYPSVGRAAAAIVEALGGKERLEVLHSEAQLVIKKTADDRWAIPTRAATRSDGSPLPSMFAPGISTERV